MDRQNSLTFGNSTEKKAAKEMRLKTLEDGVAKLSKDLAFLMGEHTTLLGKHGTLLERVAKLEVASAKNVTEHEVMKKETARVDASLWETKHAFHDAVYGGRYGKTEPEWVLLDKVIQGDIWRIYGKFQDMYAQIRKLKTQQGLLTPEPEYSDQETVSDHSVDSDEDRPGESLFSYQSRMKTKRAWSEQAKQAAATKPAVDSDNSDSSSNASVQRDGEHDYDFVDRITRKREHQKYKDDMRNVMNYRKDYSSSSDS